MKKVYFCKQIQQLDFVAYLLGAKSTTKSDYSSRTEKEPLNKWIEVYEIEASRKIVRFRVSQVRSAICGDLTRKGHKENAKDSIRPYKSWWLLMTLHYLRLETLCCVLFGFLSDCWRLGGWFSSICTNGLTDFGVGGVFYLFVCSNCKVLQSLFYFLVKIVHKNVK